LNGCKGVKAMILPTAYSPSPVISPSPQPPPHVLVTLVLFFAGFAIYLRLSSKRINRCGGE